MYAIHSRSLFDNPTILFPGTFYPGMKVNALDLSPNYSGTLMALVNGIGAFTGILTPYIVGVLASDETIGQWRLVFWIDRLRCFRRDKSDLCILREWRSSILERPRVYHKGQGRANEDKGA